MERSWQGMSLVQRRSVWRRVFAQTGFTLIELLGVVAILAVVVMIALPAVQHVRGAARQATCLNHLRQVGLAMHAHHRDHQKFPAGWIDRTRGVADLAQPEYLYGWSMALLPYLQEESLYRMADVSSGSWADDPTTAQRDHAPELLAEVYLCPSDQLSGLNANVEGGVFAKMNYGGSMGTDMIASPAQPSKMNLRGTVQVQVGQSGIFFKNSRISIDDVSDGLSNTISHGERGGQHDRRGDSPNVLLRIGLISSGLLSATDAETGAYNQLNQGCFDVEVWATVLQQKLAYRMALKTDDFGINASPLAHRLGYASAHPGGANLLMADGATRFVSEDLEIDTFKQMLNRRDHSGAARLNQYVGF